MSAVALLLPLKGRPLHTLRFLWHANRQRLPHRIVVLDGQVESAIADRLAKPHALFPALDIDYVRCPDDRTYQHYFDKMAAGCARLQTPYAMLCDNDDFVVDAGVAHAVDFLERHRDYAGISGGVAGFSLHRDGVLPNVAGVIQSLGALYHDGYVAADYAAPRLADRVRQHFARGYSLFYSVFRTEALATVLRDSAAIGFSDLRAAETFFGARMKTLGKCGIDRRVISYVRQGGTSGGSANVWTADDLRGAGPRAMEVARCLHALAGPIAAADSCDLAEVKAELRQLFADKLAAEAPSAAISDAPPQRWRDRAWVAAGTMLPAGVIAVRRRLLRRRARAEIAGAMIDHGATAAEVASARQALIAIEACLERPEFPAFLRRHAPDLLGRAGIVSRPAGRVAA